MTPQERELIESVFARLSRIAGGTKDREAETLILERMRSTPDAAYNLVEAVVVQEQAIKERDARIAELEQRLSTLPAPQAAPGGFAQPTANPWGRGSVPQAGPQPQYAQPQQYPQQPYAQPTPWGQPSAGGSFLRTAAGAAVGVAGGMLLANGISSMFAGGHGGGSPWGAQASPATENTTINNYYGATSPQPQAPTASFDSSVSDSGGYDDGGSWGGDESF